MRIIFSELIFSAMFLCGLRINLASLTSSDQWIVGNGDGGPVASLYFAGENFIWTERVI